jgi:diaminopimelate decarboxylase
MITPTLEAEILKLSNQTTRPFYVYSIAQIRDRCEQLKAAFTEDVELFYSFKANSHPTAVALIRSCGLYADVASMGELKVALDSGYVGSQIEFTGPGKTIQELEFAVQHEVTSIVLESAQELIELERICRRVGKKISAHVRLNPDSKVNFAGRQLDGEPTQFGVDGKELDHFVETMKSCHNVAIIGTHSHAQSQTLSAEHAIQNFQFALQASTKFARLARLELAYVNIGGGLGIAYSPSQIDLDLKQLSSQFKVLLKTAKSESAFSKARFRIELGRAVVGTAGRFLTRVLYTKSSRGKRFAITDGGFTQGQIMCGVGQLIRRNFTVHVIKREKVNRELVTIAGPSCYGFDILASDIELPRLDPGDLICIDNVGAYGYSFSPVGFLRQQTADEFFI